MTFSSMPRQNYLPHIDGLRGFAVLAILLFHLDLAFVPGGFVGVDIFFVISGYLITGIIAREMTAGTFALGKFYARRIKRIFPALFVMLALTSVAAVLFLGVTQFSDFFGALRKAAGQISNFYFARETDYFATGHDHSPLLHTWSLGVEEQFYLLWPMVMLLTVRFWGLAKCGVVLGVIAAVSLGISEYLVRHDAMQAFYMLHARAWELAIGGMIALNVFPMLKTETARNGIGLAGIALLVAGVLLLTPEQFPGVKAVVPVLGAALFIYAGHDGAGRVHKVMAVKPLLWTGLISYSLYLWHWPVIAFYKNFYEVALTPTVQVSMLVAAFVLAMVCYRYVEQPFRRIEVKPWKAIITGLLTIVLFIVFGNIIKEHKDSDWRVSYKVHEFVSSPNQYDKVCAITDGAFDRENCRIGPNKDGYEIIMAGDSHVGHYAPTIVAWAQALGLTVRLTERGACNTWLKMDKVPVRNGQIDEYCYTLNKEFYRSIAEDKSIKYIFLGLLLPDADVVREGIEEIRKVSNAKIIYMGQAPLFAHNPHECQIRNHLLISRWLPRGDGSQCMIMDKAYSEATLATRVPALKQYFKEAKVLYFDPVPHIKEPFDAEGRFLYLDANHLNRYGSAHLVQPFTKFMKKQGGKK